MTDEYNDKWGILWVSPQNKMEGNFTIYGINESNLDTFLTSRVVGTKDLSSTLTVRVGKTNNLDSTFKLMHKDDSDLSANVLATTSNYLDASIEVRPHGIMYGIFDIIEPPRINDVLNPKKDATTRSLEEYKYINYGSSSTMMVGNNNGDILRSFIQFDLSSYPEALTIEKAKMKLYYSGTLSNTTSLELRTADRDWDETGLTHSNRPFPDKFISNTYQINAIEKYIEFDLKDCISKIVKKEIDNYGFILKSINDVDNLTDSFLTKESSRKPILDITYFDTRVWSVGKSDLQSTLTTYGVGNKDLGATFILKTDWDKRELLSTLYIHRYDTPETTDVKAFINVNSPEINAKVTIAQTDTSDFVAKFILRRDKKEDKLAYIGMSKPELNSTLFTRYFADFESTLLARAFDTSDVLSSIKLSVPELFSTLYVRERNDLSATLTIQQNVKDDFISYLSVTKNELISNVRARAFDTDDLSSTLFIKQLEVKELSSTISVTRNELAGKVTIYIKDDNNLNATVLIYQNEKKELDSTLNTSQPEVNATLLAKVSNNVDAYLFVSRPEVYSQVTIRAINNHDMDAFVYPRVIQVNDLNAYLFTINKFRSGAYYYIL